MRPLARSLAGLSALVATLLLTAAPVAAHPLGNFSVNRYLGVTVSATAVNVDLVVDVAEIPSIELLARIDTDASGWLDAVEADAARRSLCADQAGTVRVRIDDAPATLELWAAGVQQRPGVGNLATVRLVCELRASVDLQAAASVGIVDSAEADGVGWREIVVRGDRMRVQPAAASQDVSNRLLAYPDGLLDQPLDERSLTVEVLRGGAPQVVGAVPDARPLADSAPVEPADVSGAVPGGVAGEIPGLPDLNSLSLGVGLVGLLAAGLAGAGHALSPGHGKTVMAAYLIGSRGSARDALLLGAAVTVSHTLGVLLLAALVLLASGLFPAERLYPILGAASGLTVTLIGAWLLVGCVRRLRDRHRHAHAHAHGHAHAHSPAMRLPGIGGLLAIGVAGGLVPSTAALVLLLAAVSAGQPAYGVGLALAFGLGMALVLTSIGLAIVHGRDRLGRRLGAVARLAPIGRLSAVAPWAAAVVVLIGGAVLTGQALTTTL